MHIWKRYALPANNPCPFVSNGTLPDDDPEKFFKQRGFYIDFLACQYDDLEIEYDYELDIYDYF